MQIWEINFIDLVTTWSNVRCPSCSLLWAQSLRLGLYPKTTVFLKKVMEDFRSELHFAQMADRAAGGGNALQDGGRNFFSVDHIALLAGALNRTGYLGVTCVW